MKTSCNADFMSVRGLDAVASRSRSIMIALNRDITTSYPTGENMKKHRDADALAARIAEAASQPAAFVPNAPSVAPEPVKTVEVKQAIALKPTRKAIKSRVPDGDTVAISLRPHRALLSRYVLKASDRAREAGRVISAQEIMLEVLERGA